MTGGHGVYRTGRTWVGIELLPNNVRAGDTVTFNDQKIRLIEYRWCAHAWVYEVCDDTE